MRTDNERCFTGRVFTTGLRLLGIRHQRIDLYCPWMNGRIERFFGIFKTVLRRCVISDARTMDAFTSDFARWYNELRPHQSLGGMTPLEAWVGVDPFRVSGRKRDLSFVEGGN